MRVLGIDPGLSHMGYAVIHSDAGRVSLLDVGCLTPPMELADAGSVSRLASWRAKYESHFLDERVGMWAPVVIAREGITFVRNASSSTKLGWSHGLIDALEIKLRAPSLHISTKVARARLIGRGAMEKHDVIGWAERRYGSAALLCVRPTNREHAADALLIATAALEDV